MTDRVIVERGENADAMHSPADEAAMQSPIDAMPP